MARADSWCETLLIRWSRPATKPLTDPEVMERRWESLEKVIAVCPGFFSDS